VKSRPPGRGVLLIIAANFDAEEPCQLAAATGIRRQAPRRSPPGGRRSWSATICSWTRSWRSSQRARRRAAHSTTRAEAAGHTGRRSGKGGDLLYCWGNPRTYRAGTKADQMPEQKAQLAALQKAVDAGLDKVHQCQHSCHQPQSSSTPGGGIPSKIPGEDIKRQTG